MNRHQRRRAARLKRDKYYEDYIRHLPKQDSDAPMEQGVYHVVLFHDEWCGVFKGGECNCEPEVERYQEPQRS